MEGYWVLNGPGHRAEEAAAMAVQIAEIDAATGGTVEHVIVDGGEDWVCDSCNGEVPVFQPNGGGGLDPTKLPPAGMLMPIPVLDDDVLCPRCFKNAIGDLELSRRWPGCGCPACRSAVN